MLRKTLIIFTLGFLTLSAFFIRLENFKRGEMRGIDEIVYYRMGAQVSRDISDYNTIPYGKELAAGGRELPPYFFEPLFKHPPFFTFFVALFIKIFGNSLLSAEYVALLFGVLTIPLVYLLANKLYGWQAGLLSAIIFSFDPMSVICSQKVWMETTVAFFTVLSVYFFIRALKDKDQNQFILSGAASGFAALNKYNGTLPTVAFVVYALLFDRALFRNKKFILGLIMPVLMLLPWFAWNWAVYGQHSLAMQGELHAGKPHEAQMLRNAAAFALLGLSGFLLARKVKKDFIKSKLVIRVSVAVVCLALFWPNILLSLQLTHLPVTSWAGAAFYGSPPTFYADRLLEFSSIYLIVFFAYLIPLKETTASERVLLMSPLVVLVFFSIWAGYQSRYIAAAIPFLVVIAGAWLWRVYAKGEELPFGWERLLLRACVLFILIFSLAKMQIINLYVSYPNDMCYF